MDYINDALALILVTQWAVPIIIALLAGVCGFVLWWNYTRHHVGLVHALDRRLKALAAVEDAELSEEAQRQFAADFMDIDDAMRAKDGAPALVHAWIEYSETIIDPGQPRIEATTLPGDYFLHLGDDTRVLAWWANLFVAFGLTFTFLGIIAALTATTHNLQGGDASQMSAALQTLLKLTAAKFWTSIIGVVASIVLRFLDRRWHSAALRRLNRLTQAIERGTSYVPPQRLAAEQLRELKQQSVALTEFSHQLAASIGDALGQQLQPVVAGLGGIQTTIDDFKSGSLNDFGTKLGETIKENAGAEMQGLAAALEGMTANLGSVNDRLEGASGQASAQIATAAREFSTASEAMTRAFAGLGGDISRMSDRLAAQAIDLSAHAEAQRENEKARFEAITEGNRVVMAGVAGDLQRTSSLATDGMVAAFDLLNNRVAAMASRIAGETADAEQRVRDRVAEDRLSYDAMAGGQRDVMRTMGEEMKAASSASSMEMVRAVKAAVGEAMAESSTAIRGALDGFAGATAGIQGAFDQMRAQVAGLSETMAGSANVAAERNAEVLARAANALESAAARAQTGMGEALDGAITRSAEASARAISSAFAAFGERFEGASAGLVQTLVTTAGRMETLAGAIERSTGAAGEHAGRMAEAGREAEAVGTMLGRAANDVSGAAGPIRDAVSTIQTSVGSSQELLRRVSEQGERSHAAIATIAGTLERTSDTATQAWEGYRDRFADVDRSLERALEQIKGASSEHATALVTQAGRVDTALATAVDRLASALDDIKDLAAALEDVRGRYEAGRR